MTTTATTLIRVLGTTDEVQTCGICGRDELKGTVVLDADGTVIYAGTSCAARLAGRPAATIRTEAKTADTANREALAAAREAARKAENVAFCAWVADTYGVTVSQCSDLWGKVPGLKPYQIYKAFIAATT